MAIVKLNQFEAGNSDLTYIMETLDKAMKGKNEITLSNYSGTGAPQVKVGSIFENNGTSYKVTAADITPTGYAGIANSTTFYIYYDESGGVFIFSSTGPSWSDALQGYYNGNDSNSRVGRNS